MDGIRIHGVYDVTCLNPDGTFKWRDFAPNVVTTEGKNHLLDNYLAGAAYSAAFYFGLIANTGWTAVAAGDTAAQINGTNQWKEAAGITAPDYNEAVRQTVSWGAAATGGSKTVSTTSAFTMSVGGTIKGIFMGTSSVKDGVAGVLFSAGTFSGGDKVVVLAEILLVSYALAT